MESYKTVGIVPDVHGNPKWMEWVTEFEKQKVDEIVFLGDYVDSWGYEDIEILHNLKQIINYKDTSDIKTTLLLGNHDVCYYGNGNEYICSGFRPTMKDALHQIYHLEGVFNNGYNIGNTVFTHAGITSYWLSKYFTGFTISEFLEEMNGIKTKRDGFDLLATVGHRRGGWDRTGGIFWADKNELEGYPIQGIHQYVGHTPVKEIEVLRVNDNTSITFCDTLNYGKPIIINISLTVNTDGRIVKEEEAN